MENEKDVSGNRPDNNGGEGEGRKLDFIRQMVADDIKSGKWGGRVATRFPPELRTVATSLSMILGRHVDRNALARAVLRSMDYWYQELRRGHDEAISHHWRQYSSTLGRRLTVVENGERFTGRVLDLSLADGLLLRLDGGTTRVFDGARVTVDRGGEPLAGTA